MWEPMTPNRHRPDDEIAAADPGAGAPPPAAGFGVEGEEPDRPEQAEAPPVAPGAPDTVFRTPDPADVRRERGA
ncbi:hypothetical protein JD79_02737 [Geodermatophilus normandii]|uniref:Uncharacterized protein n=2 Tax=Geodermatophilus normandii TaxID=1137989 RepID=A0A317QJP6_9ACTN|nr:hypothetical protein JD79_02737 [Geodermatophilus normandii]